MFCNSTLGDIAEEGEDSGAAEGEEPIPTENIIEDEDSGPTEEPPEGEAETVPTDSIPENVQDPEPESPGAEEAPVTTEDLSEERGEEPTAAEDVLEATGKVPDATGEEPTPTDEIQATLGEESKVAEDVSQEVPTPVLHTAAKLTPDETQTVKEWAEWFTDTLKAAEDLAAFIGSTVVEAEQKAAKKKGLVVSPDGKVQKLTKREWEEFQQETAKNVSIWRQRLRKLAEEGKQWDAKVKLVERQESQGETATSSSNIDSRPSPHVEESVMPEKPPAAVEAPMEKSLHLEGESATEETLPLEGESASEETPASEAEPQQ